MREEIRDIERLEHILKAINVLTNYKENHTLEEAQADPIILWFGETCRDYWRSSI